MFCPFPHNFHFEIELNFSTVCIIFSLHVDICTREPIVFYLLRVCVHPCVCVHACTRGRTMYGYMHACIYVCMYITSTPREVILLKLLLLDFAVISCLSTSTYTLLPLTSSSDTLHFPQSAFYICKCLRVCRMLGGFFCINYSALWHMPSSVHD